MVSAKGEVARVVYEQGDALVRLARAIHADPETAYSEHRASARLIDTLSDAGFEIRTAVSDLPTAFAASRGAGPVHFTLCAEYDALDEGVGHGSGRHLVAGAAAGAAIGLAGLVDDAGLTVSVLGTPAADLLSLRSPPAGYVRTGKAELLRGGAFADVHAVLVLVPSASFTGFARSHAQVREKYEPIPRLRQDPFLSRAFSRNADALGIARDPRVPRPTFATDLGVVSTRIPTIAPMIALGGTARVGTRDFAALSATDDGYRAMLHGAVALARTALDAATERDLRSHLTGLVL